MDQVVDISHLALRSLAGGTMGQGYPQSQLGLWMPSYLKILEANEQFLACRA